MGPGFDHGSEGTALTAAELHRRAGLAAALALAAAVGVAGGYGFTHAKTGAAASAAEEPAPSCTATAGPGGRCGTSDAAPASGGPGGGGTGVGGTGGSQTPQQAASRLPRSGTGEFTPVGGTGRRAGGSGRLVRYLVVVEGGVPVDPASFAAAVEGTLADPRGWTAGGQWSFQRVGGGRIDLTVHLATPDTTTRLCARYGLNTGGEVSCRGGPNVMINAKRWLLGVPWYADALDDYRHMLVNHEVGHFLGHGHASCPGPGRPAPVMQTQTYSLGACTRNPWPYPPA
jgi:hypothetical protein